MELAFVVHEPSSPSCHQLFYICFSIQIHEAMGAKRKKAKVAAWNFDDECSMLAFLEFRISHGELDRVKNVEAIAQHLRKKVSKRFTTSQIEDKLNEIQNQTTRKRRRGTILTDGLKALSSLPHEETVLRLKQELHDEFVMNMHSQERVTRSASRGLGSSQPQRKKHVSDLEIPESPSPSRTLSTRRSRFHLSPAKSTSPLVRKSRLTDQVCSFYIFNFNGVVRVVADKVQELSYSFKSHPEPQT